MHQLTLFSRMKEILEPLAIANNVTQARYTRLDHIGLTLGNLYRIYNTPSLEAPIRDRILGSLEKRWRAADQDVFILAMHLHPWIRGRCFAKMLSRSTLYNMADKVFRRVFEEEPDLSLLREFMDYCEGTGLYSDEGMRLAYWKQRHEDSVRQDLRFCALKFTMLCN
jgi:hypothetical protein